MQASHSSSHASQPCCLSIHNIIYYLEYYRQSSWAALLPDVLQSPPLLMHERPCIKGLAEIHTSSPSLRDPWIEQTIHGLLCKARIHALGSAIHGLSRSIVCAQHICYFQSKEHICYFQSKEISTYTQDAPIIPLRNSIYTERCSKKCA